MALCGWFGFHVFWPLATGSLLIIAFDALMSSSGGQIKHFGVSFRRLAAGGVIGRLTGYGILVTSLLAFSIYSAVVLILKLLLLLLAVLDQE